MQRVRMELSRSRQRNERKGKKNLRFSLHQSIYPWTTLDGKRLERVLVTSTRTQTHQNLELLDDLIENKGIELTLTFHNSLRRKKPWSRRSDDHTSDLQSLM